MIQALFLTAMTVGTAVIIAIVARIILQRRKRPMPIHPLAPEAEVDRRVRTWGAMNDNNFEI